jgi:hypothetical protein
MTKEKHQSLIRYLLCVTKIKTRRRLSEHLQIDEAIMSKMWNGRMVISEVSILRIHEVTSVPVVVIRQLVGVSRADHIRAGK